MFTVLLDAPDKPVKRVQVAKLGDFHDDRYGDFSITADDVATWKANLEKLPGGEALIDFEHRSERKPRDSSAAGWISGLDLDGEKVMADARWTSKGEQAINDEIYRFMSPVYGPFKDEKGNTFENTFCSATLTNKPFLGMPTVSLASPERVADAVDEDPALRFHQRALDGEYGDETQALVMLDVSQAARDEAHAAGNSLPDKSYPIENAKQLHSAAVLAASGHGNVAAAKKLIRRRAKELGVDLATLPGFGKNDNDGDEGSSADSRRSMDAETLIKTLELDEGSDDQTILDAIAALKTPPEPAAPAEPAEPVKTLEQQAQEANKRILDADTYTRLLNQAAAGETALHQLQEQRFEHAFTDAVSKRRVTPAERDTLHHFYTLDADATIKMLDTREPVVPDRPSGAPTIDLSQAEVDAETLAQNGVHPSSHQLNVAIKAKLKEKGLPDSDFPVLLDQFMRDGRLL